MHTPLPRPTALTDTPAELPSGEPRPDRRWRAAALPALMLAGLAALALLLVHQATLLDGERHYQRQYAPWAAHQLQTEALRLQLAIAQHLEQADADSLEALQLRQQILASRMDVLPREDLTLQPPSPVLHPHTLQQLAQRVAEADLLLARAQARPQPAERAAWRALAAGLQALNPALQELSQQVQSLSAQQQDDRRAALDQQRQLVAALTALQALLLLAGLGLLWRQHQLRRQRLALQRLAAERHTAQRSAEAANQAKSRFVADLAHELRTPFQGVMGMLSLLEHSPLHRRQADWVRTAQRSVRHLLGLLNDLLDLARAEAGRLGLAPEPVAPQLLVHEVLQLMQPLALAKGLKLEADLPDPLPGPLMLDPQRLRQILYNLLGNAIKYTPRGRVTLALRLMHEAPAGQAGGGAACGHGDHTGGSPGHGAGQELGRHAASVSERGPAGSAPEPAPAGPLWLEFAVSDTGPGIDAQTLSQLFERFAQGAQGSAQPRDSAGLGLQIARTLAQLMGGDIGVDSQPGAGTCFRLRLPAQRAPASAPAAAPSAAPEAGPSAAPALATASAPASAPAPASASATEPVPAAAEAAPAETAAPDRLAPVNPDTPPGADGVPAHAPWPRSGLTAPSPLRDGAGLEPASPAEAPPAGAASGPDPVAPIDTQAAERLWRSLPRERYHAIVRRLLADQHGYLRQLRQALCHAAPAQIADAARTLEGAASTLALQTLARWAGTLALASSPGSGIPLDADRRQFMLAELERELHRIAQALPAPAWEAPGADGPHAQTSPAYACHAYAPHAPVAREPVARTPEQAVAAM